MNRRRRALLALVWAAAALLLADTVHWLITVELFRTEDSRLYENAAAHFSAYLRGTSEVAVMTRAPLYPAALAAASAVLPGDAGVRLLHLAVALCTLLFIAGKMRAPVERVSALGAAALVFGEAKVLSGAVLSEWLAINLLLACFAAWYAWRRDGGARRDLFWMSCWAALAALTRPALAPVLLIPGGCALARGRARALLPLAGGLAPLLVWMAFNTVRVGSFAIAPFGGVSLLGVAGVSGEEPRLTSVDPAEQKFLDAFREAMRSVRSGSAPLPPGAASALRERQYNYLLWNVAMPCWETSGIGVGRWNTLAFRAALSALVPVPGAYAAHVAREFLRQGAYLTGSAAALIAALIAFVRRKKIPDAAAAVGVMLLLHLAHTLLCAATNVMFLRLYLCTALPLSAAAYFAAIISISTCAPSGKPAT